MAIKITKIEQLEERSEMVNEVMERKPIWIIRWGMTVFFTIITALLLMTWVIKFSDVISARTYIISSNPPAKLIAKNNGYLHLLTGISAQVEKGQPIAYLQGTADYFQVDSLLQHLRMTSGQELLKASDRVDYFRQFESLGNHQALLTDLASALENYFFEILNNPQAREVDAIKKQIAEQQKLVKQKLLQEKTLQKTYELVQKDHARNDQLFKQSVISQKAFDESKRSLLSSKNALENISGEIITTRVGISSLERSIAQIQVQIDKSAIKYRQEALKNYNTLINRLESWEVDNVFVSPIAGALQVHQQVGDNQFVGNGDHLFSILPPHEAVYKSIVQTPTFNSGKIKVGQPVNILLDDYPYQEFGLVTGRVDKISNMQKENYYLVEVGLVDSTLTTSFGRKLDYRPEMQGTAEIITEELRLIERFFYQLRSVFVKN